MPSITALRTRRIASLPGKAARGTIYLNAYHQGTQVVIEVRDDGRGIDPSRRFARRRWKREFSRHEEAQRLTDYGSASILIFEPGFSTAAEVTEVSGRGVGMDVVRTVMDRLKGTVQISVQQGSRHHDSAARAAHAGEHSDVAVPRRRAPVRCAAVLRGGNHAHQRQRDSPCRPPRSPAACASRC